MTEGLGTLPAGVWALLGVLAVVQLTLMVAALVNLVRRPAASLIFGNKWVWLAIIVLVNTVGPIIYFAAGRKPATIGQGSAPTSSSARNLADELYGQPDGDQGS